MWPTSDFEAVVFIVTVALLVALAQVAGCWPPLTTTVVPGMAISIIFSDSAKALGKGGRPGPWLRSSVGWSGARRWISRHPTRSFSQYNLHLSRMFELGRRPSQGQGIC